LVPPIDRLWKDYENAMNDIATEDQWKAHGRLAIGKPGRSPLDTESMDRVVPWFDTIIGICLILGLCTRPAAIVGALFLLSICASQWPLTPGAAPIYNQAVEGLALLSLAAIGAGRFFGIDAICCPFKKQACQTQPQPQPVEKTAKPTPVAVG